MRAAWYVAGAPYGLRVFDETIRAALPRSRAQRSAAPGSARVTHAQEASEAARGFATRKESEVSLEVLSHARDS